jgi:hypothetical protein
MNLQVCEKGATLAPLQNWGNCGNQSLVKHKNSSDGRNYNDGGKDVVRVMKSTYTCL